MTQTVYVVFFVVGTEFPPLPPTNSYPVISSLITQSVVNIYRLMSRNVMNVAIGLNSGINEGRR